MDLCKILAGLQPHHVGKEAHVMLIARQDCHHDQNMIKIVMAKFNTFTHVSKSPMKGWPDGPNGMFGSTMMHIANNQKKNQYECVYWMEPDAIPLCPNWFSDLLQVWRTRHIKSLVVGCRGDCNGDGSGDHITGCALYHPNIAKLMPEICGCTGQAWDYKYRAKIVANGGHTPLIENFYNARNLPMDIVDRSKNGVRIIHGAKDRSVVNSVAKKYGINI
jgi:hypothetical protein